MKILRVKKTSIFDIFSGQGWEGWSRYYIHEGNAAHVGGAKLPRYVVEKIKQEINK